LARTRATNLLRRGHRVICVDNLETGSLGNIEHLRDPAVVYYGYDIVAEQGYSAAEIAAQLGHADRGVTALRWYVRPKLHAAPTAHRPDGTQRHAVATQVATRQPNLTEKG
jgi:hypothetical protein